MLRRSHYVAAGAVVLLTLLVLNLPGRTTARLKLAIGSLFLPLFGLASGAQQATSKASDALVPRSELIKQNETLRHENQQFRAKAIQAAKKHGIRAFEGVYSALQGPNLETPAE